jgi:uncharacterized protein HemY
MQSLKESDAGWQRALAMAKKPAAHDAATLTVLQSELRARAQLLTDAGDYEAALATVKTLLGIEPNDPVAAEINARLIAASDRVPASAAGPARASRQP